MKDGTRLRLEMSLLEMDGTQKKAQTMSSYEFIQDGLKIERGFELSREHITWEEALALNGVACCPFQANAD